MLNNDQTIEEIMALKALRHNIRLQNTNQFLIDHHDLVQYIQYIQFIQFNSLETAGTRSLLLYGIIAEVAIRCG